MKTDGLRTFGSRRLPPADERNIVRKGLSFLSQSVATSDAAPCGFGCLVEVTTAAGASIRSFSPAGATCARSLAHLLTGNAKAVAEAHFQRILARTNPRQFMTSLIRLQAQKLRADRNRSWMATKKARCCGCSTGPGYRYGRADFCAVRWTSLS